MNHLITTCALVSLLAMPLHAATCPELPEKGLDTVTPSQKAVFPELLDTWQNTYRVASTGTPQIPSDIAARLLAIIALSMLCAAKLPRNRQRRPAPYRAWATWAMSRKR